MIFLEPSGMNNKKLDKIIHQISEHVDGEPGLWQFRFADLTLVCVTDESHDRMRVMCPITNADQVTASQITECLAANFDRALDARYCLSNGTLWGAFIHPLNCLDEPLFASACHQVSEVAKNFGGSYCSGGLSFNSRLLD